MRLSALESVRNAAEDLIKQASDDQDEAVQGQCLSLSGVLNVIVNSEK